MSELKSFEKNYSRSTVYTENQSQKPKKMFVDLGNIIENHFTSTPFHLLDLGAAAGGFLSYISQRFPSGQTTGVEFDPILVQSAIDNGFNVLEGDANDLGQLEDHSFDVVTLTGTHSIFDRFEPSFSESLRVCKKGGLVIVTGIFNPFPIDVRIHWKYSEKPEMDWHPGYNLFSQNSVSRFLDKHEDVRSYSFNLFFMDQELPPQEDPIRSWTYQNDEKGYHLRNGIMPLNFQILRIEK